MFKRIILIAGLCLLLPLAAQAWSPETIYEEREELPAQVQALLPEEVVFLYAYPAADTVYAWTKDTGGNGVAFVFGMEDGAYTLQSRSAPLGVWNGFAPMLGYCGKAFYTIQYSEGFSFSFHPGADGRWVLGSVFVYGETDCFITVYPNAAVEFRSDREGLRRVYGAWTQPLYADVLDSSVLPQSFDDVLSMLDTTGWAVVQADAPQATVALRAEPSAEAETLASYYSGAPVQVLEAMGTWRRVEIAGAEGWLPEKALAFGEDMREVAPEFPMLAFTEAAYAQGNILHTAPSVQSETIGMVGDSMADGPDIVEGLMIIGIVNDTWYHVMNFWGDTGYIESKWFFEGNG